MSKSVFFWRMHKCIQFWAVIWWLNIDLWMNTFFYFKKVMGSNDDCLRKEYISVGKKWFFESSVVFSHLITFILVSNKQWCAYKNCTISFGNRYTVFDNFDQYSFFCQTGQGQGCFNWAQSETLDFKRKISYIPKEDITYTQNMMWISHMIPKAWCGTFRILEGDLSHIQKIWRRISGIQHSRASYYHDMRRSIA